MVIISEDFESYVEGELPPGWFQMDLDEGYCGQFGRSLNMGRFLNMETMPISGTNVAMCHYNDGMPSQS